MDLQFKHVDPNFYELEENEIQVSIDAAEQEAAAAAEKGNFEGSVDGPDKLKNGGIPDHKDGVIHDIGDDIKDESHGSYQGSGHPQLEKQENLAAARVPQLRRTRPRIQFGFTPRQLRELEEVFKQTMYPDETTRRALARRLFLGESKVRLAMQLSMQGSTDSPIRTRINGLANADSKVVSQRDQVIRDDTNFLMCIRCCAEDDMIHSSPGSSGDACLMDRTRRQLQSKKKAQQQNSFQESIRHGDWGSVEERIHRKSWYKKRYEGIILTPDYVTLVRASARHAALSPTKP